jgi:hypothetical protein
LARLAYESFLSSLQSDFYKNLRVLLPVPGGSPRAVEKTPANFAVLKVDS